MEALKQLRGARGACLTCRKRYFHGSGNGLRSEGDTGEVVIYGSDNCGGDHFDRDLRNVGRTLARDENHLGRGRGVAGRRYARGYVCIVGARVDAGRRNSKFQGVAIPRDSGERRGRVDVVVINDVVYTRGYVSLIQMVTSGPPWGVLEKSLSEVVTVLDFVFLLPHEGRGGKTFPRQRSCLWHRTRCPNGLARCQGLVGGRDRVSEPVSGASIEYIFRTIPRNARMSSTRSAQRGECFS